MFVACFDPPLTCNVWFHHQEVVGQKKQTSPASKQEFPKVE